MESDFPCLPFPNRTSVLGAPPSSSTPSGMSYQPTSASPGIWKDLFLHNDNSKSISLSFIPPTSDEIIFSADEIQEGGRDWDLSLIGHALGKRPFYGALLAAIKKKWTFKGIVDLLSLDGDFFLFKFSCREDYSMVWDHGPCYLNGRPFFFQQWAWDFQPTKADISQLPIWIKLPNLPLCCWNDTGLSKIASKIGIPLAVDSLTASNRALPLPDSACKCRPLPLSRRAFL